MKLRTKKSMLKRLKISSNNKISHRQVGQGHFNAKETGSQTMSKRKDRPVDKTLMKKIKKRIPYNFN